MEKKYESKIISKTIITENTICHASFTQEPSKETLDAVKAMADIAYRMDFVKKTKYDLSGLKELASTNKPWINKQ